MRILLAGFPLLVFSTQVFWVTYSPVTSSVAAELGVGKEAVGFLVALFPLIYIFMAYPAGLLLDKSLRHALGLAALLYAVAAILRLAGPADYGYILAAQVLAGIGQPIAINGIAPYASAYFEQQSRPLAVSASSAAMYAGMIAGMALGAPVYNSYGLWGLALYSSAVTLVSSLWTLAMVYLAAPVSAAGAAKSSSLLAGLKTIARRRDIWLLAGLLGLGLSILDIIMAWVEPVFAAMGIGGVAGTAAASMVLAGVVGAAVIPPVAARRNARRSFLVAAALSGVVAYTILALVPHPALAVLLLALNGFLFMAGLPIIFDWIEATTPLSQQGEAVGVIMLISHVMAVLLIAATTPLLETPILFMASLAGLAAIATLLALALPRM